MFITSELPILLCILIREMVNCLFKRNACLPVNPTFTVQRSERTIKSIELEIETSLPLFQTKSISRTRRNFPALVDKRLGFPPANFSSWHVRYHISFRDNGKIKILICYPRASKISIVSHNQSPFSVVHRARVLSKNRGSDTHALKKDMFTF